MRTGARDADRLTYFGAPVGPEGDFFSVFWPDMPPDPADPAEPLELLPVADEGSALRFEAVVARIALEWALASRYATDVLFEPGVRAAVDALVVLDGFQAEPLAAALQAGPLHAREERLAEQQSPESQQAQAVGEEAPARLDSPLRVYAVP